MNGLDFGSVVSDDGFSRVLPCFRFGDWLIIFDTGDKSVKFVVESDYNQHLERNYGKKLSVLQSETNIPYGFSSERDLDANYERSSDGVVRPPLPNSGNYAVDSAGNPVTFVRDSAGNPVLNQRASAQDRADYTGKLDANQLDQDGNPVTGQRDGKGNLITKPYNAGSTQYSVDSDGNPIELHTDDFN